jgi:hypothetical protein
MSKNFKQVFESTAHTDTIHAFPAFVFLLHGFDEEIYDKCFEKIHLIHPNTVIDAAMADFETASRNALKRSFSEIPTRFLTPYREFEQRPHTPHWRQLASNSRNRKYSRVTSTFTNLFNAAELSGCFFHFSQAVLTKAKITSTTLYITCIAGCQYNFIHITRILFNFANDITGCQYNFIYIIRILFNFANDIAGCQYNYIHITRILFNFTNDIAGCPV